MAIKIPQYRTRDFGSGPLPPGLPQLDQSGLSSVLSGLQTLAQGSAALTDALTDIRTTRDRARSNAEYVRATADMLTGLNNYERTMTQLDITDPNNGQPNFGTYTEEYGRTAKTLYDRAISGIHYPDARAKFENWWAIENTRQADRVNDKAWGMEVEYNISVAEQEIEKETSNPSLLGSRTRVRDVVAQLIDGGYMSPATGQKIYSEANDTITHGLAEKFLDKMVFERGADIQTTLEWLVSPEAGETLGISIDNREQMVGRLERKWNLIQRGQREATKERADISYATAWDDLTAFISSPGDPTKTFPMNMTEIMKVYGIDSTKAQRLVDRLDRHRTKTEEEDETRNNNLSLARVDDMIRRKDWAGAQDQLNQLLADEVIDNPERERRMDEIAELAVDEMEQADYNKASIMLERFRVLDEDIGGATYAYNKTEYPNASDKDREHWKKEYLRIEEDKKKAAEDELGDPDGDNPDWVNKAYDDIIYNPNMTLAQKREWIWDHVGPDALGRPQISNQTGKSMTNLAKSWNPDFDDAPLKVITDFYKEPLEAARTKLLEAQQQAEGTSGGRRERREKRVQEALDEVNRLEQLKRADMEGTNRALQDPDLTREEQMGVAQDRINLQRTIRAQEESRKLINQLEAALAGDMFLTRRGGIKAQDQLAEERHGVVSAINEYMRDRGPTGLEDLLYEEGFTQPPAVGPLAPVSEGPGGWSLRTLSPANAEAFGLEPGQYEINEDPSSPDYKKIRNARTGEVIGVIE